MLKESTQFKILLGEIKSQISSSQQNALLAVNRELTLLYWNIGNSILEAQAREGWGSKIIDVLANEIKICARGTCTNSLVS